MQIALMIFVYREWNTFFTLLFTFGGIESIIGITNFWGGVVVVVGAWGVLRLIGEVFEVVGISLSLLLFSSFSSSASISLSVVGSKETTRVFAEELMVTVCTICTPVNVARGGLLSAC